MHWGSVLLRASSVHLTHLISFSPSTPWQVTWSANIWFMKDGKIKRGIFLNQKENIEPQSDDTCHSFLMLRTLALNWGPAFDYSLGSHALMGMDGQYVNVRVCFLRRKKFTITSSVIGIRPRPVNICWASALPSMAFTLRWMLPELQLMSRHHVLNLERFGFEC